MEAYNENSPTVNVAIATCDRCRCMRSRRGGHVVDLDTRQHFICADCLNALEREAHRDFLRAADLRGGAA